MRDAKKGLIPDETSRTGYGSSGPICRLMAEDHARLGTLLAKVGSCSTPEQRSAYDNFRRGLLRHISMEEKILLPAAARVRGGKPLPIAAKLRLDHGALVSLMIPSPTPTILSVIEKVLASHNRLEEGPGGVYEICEELLGANAGETARALRASPQVPTLPNSDTPKVIGALKRALSRAGFDEEAGLIDSAYASSCLDTTGTKER